MGFMHTESAPLLKHDYNYKHTTIREALGSAARKCSEGAAMGFLYTDYQAESDGAWTGQY